MLYWFKIKRHVFSVYRKQIQVIRAAKEVRSLLAASSADRKELRERLIEAHNSLVESVLDLMVYYEKKLGITSRRYLTALREESYENAVEVVQMMASFYRVSFGKEEAEKFLGQLRAVCRVLLKESLGI